MQLWIIYSILAMIFAGVTAVLAKYGLQNISADLGLGIRTAIIFFLVIVLNLFGNKFKEISNLTNLQLILLAASAVTTTLSWIFYFRAIKEGPVSYVSAIDKASILITLVLSFVLLKEPVTLKILSGAVLILAGMLILIWK
jgi:bacterial/archaeal transporter family protein